MDTGMRNFDTKASSPENSWRVLCSWEELEQRKKEFDIKMNLERDKLELKQKELDLKIELNRRNYPVDMVDSYTDKVTPSVSPCASELNAPSVSPRDQGLPPELRYIPSLTECRDGICMPPDSWKALDELERDKLAGEKALEYTGKSVLSHLLTINFDLLYAVVKDLKKSKNWFHLLFVPAYHLHEAIYKVGWAIEATGVRNALVEVKNRIDDPVLPEEPVTQQPLYDEREFVTPIIK